MNRIAALRKEHKMSQRELAARLGVGDATVTKYESEDIRLTEDKLRMMSLIFDVSTDYILGLSDERKRGTTYTAPHIAALLSCAGNLSEEDRKVLLDCASDPDAMTLVKEYLALSKKSKKQAVVFLDLLKVYDTHRGGQAGALSSDQLKAALEEAGGGSTQEK